MGRFMPNFDLKKINNNRFYKFIISIVAVPFIWVCLILCMGMVLSLPFIAIFKPDYITFKKEDKC